MKLEGIDPQHPSLYFVLTVAEVSAARTAVLRGLSGRLDRRRELPGHRGSGSEEGDLSCPQKAHQLGGRGKVAHTERREANKHQVARGVVVARSGRVLQPRGRALA